MKGHVEALLKIPAAVVNLVDVEKSVELAKGEFSLVRLADEEDRSIAIYAKVGKDLRWPLAKDVPIVKVDARHYLFSVRAPPAAEENAGSAKSGGGVPDVLNFGVSFGEIEEERLELLDKWLKECACLSLPGSSWRSWCLPSSEDEKSGGDSEAYWTVLAPKLEEYNSMMGKAIAAGSGSVVKGIFMCSDAYSSQVRKGGKLVRSRMKASENKPSPKTKKSSSEISPRVKKNVKRIKKLSEMTETMSNIVVEGVYSPLDTMGGFPAQSTCCKCRFSKMLPGGEVLLASLDAYNKILEAAQVAGKDAGRATSQEAAEIIAQRYGEDAGELTQDTMEIAGHAIGTGVNLTRLGVI